MNAHRVDLTEDAERHVTVIDAWWRENREAAPGLFMEELVAAFDLLQRMPLAGIEYDNGDVPEVRRVLLRSTRYHVYYRVRANVVVVLAVWSGYRGTGPSLGRLI